jgi:signal transduction histidine kinase
VTRRFRSVRVRTTLVATAAVGVAMILAAWTLVVVLQRSLIAGVDNSLKDRTADVIAMAKEGDFLDEPIVPGQPGALVQVVDPSDRVVASSETLRAKPAIGPFRDLTTGHVAWSARITSDDELYRIVGVSTATPGGPVTIYTAASLETISDTVTTVKAALLIGLPLVLLMVAAACWWIVGRALRPVEAIRAQVSEIGSGGLDRRVPEPSAGDEIGRLARTMNEMLDRLQSASDLQRRFVADASHELRSPIASLRTQIEVQQVYANGSNGEGEAALSNQLAEVTRMERLVGDLLMLAKADERRLSGRSETVPLHRIVLEEVARSGGPEHVRVDTSAVRAAAVVGDRDGLARVVRNLLENAHRHARSRVEVGLRPEGDQVLLTVANDGPGIPAEARSRIFERFTRMDESRARDDGGAGLGLAIVREVVAAHGGAVRVEDRTSGACFIVSLPQRDLAHRVLD